MRLPPRLLAAHLSTGARQAPDLPCNIGALTTRIGFPVKVTLKGVYKGSIVGFYNIGALIIRIGFPLKVALKGSIRDL